MKRITKIKGRAGMNLRGSPEIGPDGGVLLKPCVP